MFSQYSKYSNFIYLQEEAPKQKHSTLQYTNN